MSSKTDLRAYFKRRETGSDGPATKKKNPNAEMIASATEHVNRVDIEMFMDEVETSTPRQSFTTIYQNIFVWRLEICLSS